MVVWGPTLADYGQQPERAESDLEDYLSDGSSM